MDRWVIGIQLAIIADTQCVEHVQLRRHEVSDRVSQFGHTEKGRSSYRGSRVILEELSLWHDKFVDCRSPSYLAATCLHARQYDDGETGACKRKGAMQTADLHAIHTHH